MTVPLWAGFYCHPTHTSNYESSFSFHHNTPPPSGPCVRSISSLSLFHALERSVGGLTTCQRKGVHAYGVGGSHGMIGATARTAGASKHSAGEGRGLRHPLSERRGGVVDVRAVCASENVPTGRCHVCTSVTVEDSGQAICWSLTRSVLVLEPDFHL